MIRMFNVYKSYQRGVEVLKGIDLWIRKGEFVFITGPSGSGKTTLLKLFFCSERATSGQILVNGRNIGRIPEKDIPYLRRDMGIVFQDFKLLNHRKVFDNVAIALEILGLRKRLIKKNVLLALKLVGLQDKENRYPLQLSAGEQQRVAIARAVVNNPSLIIADEPTGNLDMKIALEIMDLLNYINSKGTTVVVATHDDRLIKLFNKRVIRLHQGKLIEH